MDLDKLCSDLEKEELESPTDVSSPLLYGQLLAIYLYKNDLYSAKFLWKRIPQNLIVINPELEVIWSIGQKMWKKDLPGCYNSIASYNWIDPLLSIIKQLENKIRDSAFNLISKAYSTVSLETVSSMTGLTGDSLKTACQDKKWELIDNGTAFKPIPASPSEKLITSSEDQMYKLTEFVCFLEN